MADKDDSTHKEYVAENITGVFVEDPALERRCVETLPSWLCMHAIDKILGSYGRWTFG